MNKEEYREYLQSTEWQLLRHEVKLRSMDVCERCKMHLAAHVHHLTYERIGKERLEDLQHVCKECHEFLHGKNSLDPAAKAEGLTEEEKVRKYGLFVHGEFYYGAMALYHWRRMK